MRSTRTFLMNLAVLGALMLARGVVPAATDPAGNPYSETITNRNVFGLKAPPPPPNPEDLAKKDPPPKILLQGITTVLGAPQVLFKSQLPAKPSQPAKEESFVMAEGERQGEIEVLDIDVNAETVKFKNHGTEELLNMKDHVAKAPTGPPPTLPGVPQPGALPPGAPQPGRAAIPVPSPNASFNPSVPGGVTTIGGPRTIPTRDLRTTPATGGGGLPVSGDVSGHAQPQAAPQLDAESAAVLYEVNRLNNEEMTRAGLRPKLPEHPLFSGALKRLNQPPANPPQDSP